MNRSLNVGPGKSDSKAASRKIAPSPLGRPCRLFLLSLLLAVNALLFVAATCAIAGDIPVPNGSFEAPVVPPESPYATPEVDSWQKMPQPAWYDPAQNYNTPWDQLAGTFYNVPFPGQSIENCDGAQASFLFALPETGFFQDFNSLSGTNTTPSHAFNAAFAPGKAYALTVGVIGGGGGMLPGATLEISLYYRDALNNPQTVAATTVTNSADTFPVLTRFVDFQVNVPGVRPSDPWAGQKIGIRLLSTVGFDLASGYWDLDDVRLTESVAPDLRAGQVANGQFTFTLLSEPGLRFEIQATTNLALGDAGWSSLRTVTNLTGADVLTDDIAGATRRFYRVRQL